MGLAVALTLAAQPVLAQVFGGRSVEGTNCATAIGGDVHDSTITTVCGMPPEQVVELVRLAASPQAGDRAELFARLSGLIPASSQLRIEAIVKFFQLLGEAPVEESQLANRFAQIAAEHRRLIEDVKNLQVSNPEVPALREQASAALEIADHATARARLAQARSLVHGKRETLTGVLVGQQREEAALVFEQGRVESARLAYKQAAQLFAEAAGLLPPGDIETRWRYFTEKAHAEKAMGDEFGKNSALVEAIASYRAVLLLVPRSEWPLQWAATQNSLGNALMILGERETGTARLEEAVGAFREALIEWTRVRQPLAWAATQGNLGNALTRLGERESGTARFEEAVAAYREAMRATIRAWAPLNWATTQNNLGTALTKLGERETGTARLEEAVAAYRDALMETTRGRVPLEWARTQNNFGNTLMILGERETGTARLEEAAAAYRDALMEKTRGRVPLEWALTQNNLGNALMILGERETGTARLEEAAAAYRDALMERTRGRVPLDWVQTQSNL
jgi:tetratricopeptide (TPR) repeat protein